MLRFLELRNGLHGIQIKALNGMQETARLLTPRLPTELIVESPGYPTPSRKPLSGQESILLGINVLHPEALQFYPDSSPELFFSKLTILKTLNFLPNLQNT